jgi:hypothetical protein
MIITIACHPPGSDEAPYATISDALSLLWLNVIYRRRPHLRIRLGSGCDADLRRALEDGMIIDEPLSMNC